MQQELKMSDTEYVSEHTQKNPITLGEDGLFRINEYVIDSGFEKDEAISYEILSAEYKIREIELCMARLQGEKERLQRLNNESDTFVFSSFNEAVDIANSDTVSFETDKKRFVELCNDIIEQQSFKVGE